MNRQAARLDSAEYGLPGYVNLISAHGPIRYL
jgi:hypothetical protein